MLDRALMNIQFMNQFHIANLEYLERKTFDHKPLLLHVSDSLKRYGPLPFSFQNMWRSYDDFLCFIKQVRAEPVPACGFTKLAVKLKRTKLALKTWNKNVFGKVNVMVNDLENHMLLMEETLQSAHLVEIKEEYRLLKTKLECLEKWEDTQLIQIEKKKWLIDGDQNIKYSHAVIKQKQHKLVIEQMKLEDGTLLDSLERIHDGAIQYFQAILSEHRDRELPNLQNLVNKEMSMNKMRIWFGHLWKQS